MKYRHPTFRAEVTPVILAVNYSGNLNVWCLVSMGIGLTEIRSFMATSDLLKSEVLIMSI